jgi:hypothetical protein
MKTSPPTNEEQVLFRLCPADLLISVLEITAEQNTSSIRAAQHERSAELYLKRPV